MDSTSSYWWFAGKVTNLRSKKKKKSASEIEVMYRGFEGREYREWLPILSHQIAPVGERAIERRPCFFTRSLHSEPNSGVVHDGIVYLRKWNSWSKRRLELSQRALTICPHPRPKKRAKNDTVFLNMVQSITRMAYYKDTLGIRIETQDGRKIHLKLNSEEELTNWLVALTGVWRGYWDQNPRLLPFGRPITIAEHVQQPRKRSIVDRLLSPFRRKSSV